MQKKLSLSDLPGSFFEGWIEKKTLLCNKERVGCIQITFPKGRILVMDTLSSSSANTLLYYLKNMPTQPLPYTTPRLNITKPTIGYSTPRTSFTKQSNNKLCRRSSCSNLSNNDFGKLPLNGRTNASELIENMDWLSELVQKYLDEWFCTIPQGPALERNEKIHYQFIVNFDVSTIEWVVSSTAKTLYPSMFEFSNTIGAQRDSVLQTTDTADVFEMWLKTQQNTFSSGWRVKETVFPNKTFEEIVGVIESKALGKIILMGSEIADLPPRHQEIWIELSGNPSFKLRKIKQLAEMYGFHDILEHVSIINSTSLFVTVKVVIVYCDVGITKIRVIVGNIEQNIIRKVLGSDYWDKHGIMRDMSTSILGLEWVEYSQNYEFRETEEVKCFVHYDAGYEIKNDICLKSSSEL
ncbi:PH domain-containing protein [Entamoeba marina]